MRIGIEGPGRPEGCLIGPDRRLAALMAVSVLALAAVAVASAKGKLSWKITYGTAAVTGGIALATCSHLFGRQRGERPAPVGDGSAGARGTARRISSATMARPQSVRDVGALVCNRMELIRYQPTGDHPAFIEEGVGAEEEPEDSWQRLCNRIQRHLEVGNQVLIRGEWREEQSTDYYLVASVDDTDKSIMLSWVRSAGGDDHRVLMESEEPESLLVVCLLKDEAPLTLDAAEVDLGSVPGHDGVETTSGVSPDPDMADRATRVLSAASAAAVAGAVGAS